MQIISKMMFEKIFEIRIKTKEGSEKWHCLKSVRIRSFSGPYFSVFGLKMDQKNSEYGYFLSSVVFNNSGNSTQYVEHGN